MTVWQLLDILWKILDPDMKDMKVYLALFQLFYFYDSNIVSYEWDVKFKNFENDQRRKFFRKLLWEVGFSRWGIYQITEAATRGVL